MEWRVIPSFPDYEASSEGQIRRRTPKKNGAPIWLLKPQKDMSPGGYVAWMVGLLPPRGKPSVRRPIARLICEAFHGPAPNSDQHAAHKDGNSSNNVPDNLYWATPRENIYDQMRHGTFATVKNGRRAGRDPADAKAMAFLHARGVPATLLGEAFGISRSRVWHLIKAAHRDCPDQPK